jgi:psp operon transcriptional activator
LGFFALFFGIFHLMSPDRPETLAIVGEAPVFLEMLEHVSRAAPLSKPVLVIGERGTGKELVASRLHYLSERWEQPLIKVNCAALTESLLESELFGHEAGAFTGATRTHLGQFEQSSGGTLVLDELGTIPTRMQEKILRVIEYGEFRRVGGSETLVTDVRVVGVTNVDLPKLAARGEFRADLLDRLAFDVIHVPPLRSRPEDILTLAYHFAVNLTSELKRPFFPGFSGVVQDELITAQWPGNVRELKNTIERSVYRAADPDLPLAEIISNPFASPFAPMTASTPDAEPGGEAPDRNDSTAVTFPIDFKATIADRERQLLEAALSRSNQNQRIAANLLELTYDQLRGLVRKYRR